MKKIYLIHRWGGNSQCDWYQLIKEKFNDKFEVSIFNMPNTETPKIKEWVSYLNDNINSIDDQIYFVGHSIGCQTIMRYLEMKDVTKIGGCLFIAPWTKLIGLEDDEKEIAKEWIETNIDFEKIKKFTSNITCIFSKDDYYVPFEEINYFKDKLNAKIKIFEKMGHFTEDDNITNYDFILNEVKEIIDNREE